MMEAYILARNTGKPPFLTDFKSSSNKPALMTDAKKFVTDRFD